jgi:hypothetical protein
MRHEAGTEGAMAFYGCSSISGLVAFPALPRPTPPRPLLRNFIVLFDLKDSDFGKFFKPKRL